MSETSWWDSWGADLTGSALGAAGAYMGAQYGSAQPGQVGNLNPQAAAWTQLLGLSTIGGFKDTLKAGNQGLLGGYGTAAGLTSQLPGVASQATKQALGQVAGAEQGAIQHALKAQTAQLGQVQQQGAASGFYGNSAQQSSQGQVYANTSQTIADIMAGSAQTKAGVIGQGASSTMSGIIAAAQGQQAMGEAYAKASGAEYNLMKDKLNTILATGNHWGIGKAEQSALMGLAGGLTAAGMPPSWFKSGAGDPLAGTIWGDNSLGWFQYAMDGGWLDDVWG